MASADFVNGRPVAKTGFGTGVVCRLSFVRARRTDLSSSTAPNPKLASADFANGRLVAKIGFGSGVAVSRSPAFIPKLALADFVNGRLAEWGWFCNRLVRVVCVFVCSAYYSWVRRDHASVSSPRHFFVDK